MSLPLRIELANRLIGHRKYIMPGERRSAEFGMQNASASAFVAQQLSVTLENDKVKHILLSVDFDLSVKQVMDKYGIPDAVMAGKAGLPDDPYIRLDLLYPMQGLTFSAQMLPIDSPVLEPSAKIYEAQFAVPAKSLAEWKSSNSDRELHS